MGIKMDQKQIDTLFNLTILIHEHEWFGERKETRNREEVQEWVSKKLASTMGVYTIPMGMSWGVLTDKENFNRYWNDNSKIKD